VRGELGSGVSVPEFPAALGTLLEFMLVPAAFSPVVFMTRAARERERSARRDSEVC